MIISDEGKDCKNRVYKRMSLKGAKDLSQQKFYKLQPLFRIEDKAVKWLCLCDCGNLTIIRGNHLTNGEIKSCGCLKIERAHERCRTNLVGKKFGELLVIERTIIPNTNISGWKCQCSCGKTTIVKQENLISGNTTSCGHKVLQIEDLSGKVFGYWTVIKMSERKEHHIYWECKCRCGSIRTIRGDGLKNGTTTSCGCKVSSQGADKIENFLKNNNLRYQKEYCFPNLLSPKRVPLRFDFAILNENDKVNYLIEYDGELHYQCRKDFGGQEGLKYRIQCDQIKNKFCVDNGIPLHRIPYFDLKEFTFSDIINNKYLLQ